jgi:hypothetical protein
MLETIYAIIVVITCLTAKNNEYSEVSDSVPASVDKVDKGES